MHGVNVEEVLADRSREQSKLSVWFAIAGLFLSLCVAAVAGLGGWFWNTFLVEPTPDADRPWLGWAAAGIALLLLWLPVPFFVMTPGYETPELEGMSLTDHLLRRHNRVAGQVLFATLMMIPRLIAEGWTVRRKFRSLPEEQARNAQAIVDELFALNDWVPAARYADRFRVVKRLVDTDIVWTKEHHDAAWVRLDPKLFP
ncbi:MAG: hypothetical protein AAGH92_08535 [Planctomycetota bacterium]